MATIKATCPTCGDVDLTPRDVQVTVARALGWSTYSFNCPECHDKVTKDADDEVVHLLTGAGVRVHRLQIPDEVLEEQILSETNLAFSSDDLLDFALWLDRTDDIVAAFSHAGE